MRGRSGPWWMVGEPRSRAVLRGQKKEGRRGKLSLTELYGFVPWCCTVYALIRNRLYLWHGWEDAW